MRVLAACEESQAVCKAFRERGHEAYSCDIIPLPSIQKQWPNNGEESVMRTNEARLAWNTRAPILSESELKKLEETT